MDYEKRRERLMERLREKGIDAVFILNFENSSWASSVYLTGFTGSHSEILITDDASYLITDGRYTDQASEETDVEVITVGSGEDGIRTLKSLLRKHGVKKLGIEKRRLIVSDHEKLESLGVTLEGVDDTLQELRSVKEESEVAAIREAVKIAEEVFEEVAQTVRPGMTEREIAALMEYHMKLRCEGPSFPTIVASGPMSAMPHAKPTDRRIERGDVVILDFGARVRGYVSDITRTILMKPVDPQVEEVVEAVISAQDAVFEGFKPGMSGRDVDNLAREKLEDLGFGSYFSHSLGHGIGLEVHEAPTFSQRNDESIPVGSTMTVEPGVYITGKFGVRIEEDVFVTKKGLERLTTISRIPLRI